MMTPISVRVAVVRDPLTAEWVGVRIESVRACCGTAQRAGSISAAIPPCIERRGSPVGPTGLGVLETAVLAEAWADGAYDVSRRWRMPLPPGSDPRAPGGGITAWFLADVYAINFDGEDFRAGLRGEERADLIEVAARDGWVSYGWKPMRGLSGPLFDRWRRGDGSLHEDGSRDPERAPRWTMLELTRDCAREWIYQLAPDGSESDAEKIGGRRRK